VTPFVARLERFASVDSTQAVVAGWLAAGAPEVAVAVADSQTHGRGRLGRRWEAPPGSSLLVSCGFRPSWMAAAHSWRLGAIVALAMVDAAEETAGLGTGALGLKWPNDLATEDPDGRLRKLGGVLGEVALDVISPTGTAAAGGVPRGNLPTAHVPQVASAVVGTGVNVAWPRVSFPADLAPFMTSLIELAGGRPVDRNVLLDAFLAHLEPRYEALRSGWFDQGAWWTRQLLTNRQVTVAVGGMVVEGEAAGVDPETGALLVETTTDAAAGVTTTVAERQAAVSGRQRLVVIDSGEVTSCRLR
jgi:BirA family transcriptional regulator, biotin operon repressor / biotin---[acetyl-CoA-carboxylase] ligase